MDCNFEKEISFNIRNFVGNINSAKRYNNDKQIRIARVY